MVAMVVLSFRLTIDSTPATNPHVRSSSRSIAALIEQAKGESPTFAQLIDQLDASDVIVHVEPDVRLRQGLAGAMHHTITTRGQIRYLRVTINPQRSRERTIGLIATSCSMPSRLPATRPSSPKPTPTGSSSASVLSVRVRATKPKTHAMSNVV